MKRAILIAIAAISTAYAGDWNEFNRQQAEWQAAFDRRQEAFDRQQAEWQAAFDRRHEELERQREHREIIRSISELEE